MADGDFPFSTIPGLTPAANAEVTDEVWINQNGLDRRATLAQVIALGTGGQLVTSVSSATPDLTVANPTTTPVLTVVSAPKWTTPRSLLYTGDASGIGTLDGSLNVTIPLTLATVNANPGTYGDATHVPRFTVDANGRITSASNVAITVPAGTVTNVSSTTGDLSVANGTSTPALTVNSAPKWSAARILSFTGDATGSGSVDGSINVATALTLATVNAAPGTYGDASHVAQVTVNAKGLVTGVTSVPLPAPGTGTVTSVALTAPAIFTVGGSPITTAGTIALGLATQAANLVFAGPASGVAAAPTFRALAAADIPSLSGLYLSLTGGTVNGPLTVSAGGASVTGGLTAAGSGPLIVDGAAATSRNLQFTTAGSLRWQLNVSAIAESGGNAGSNFNLQACSDAGAVIFTPIGITRSTGLVSLFSGASVTGGLAVIGTTARGVLIGQGAAALTSTAAGAAGQALMGQGAAADPTFRALIGTDLPNPGAASKGGVQSIGPVANQWINSISTAGVPSLTQPATSNLSDRDAAATSFSPTVSVTTIGDGVFSGLTVSGQYRRLGFLVWFYVNVAFTLTFTTASGALSIGGFPLPPTAGLAGYVPYWVSYLPASPADHLMGTLQNSLLVGTITGNSNVGNFWGPNLGLVSGTAYRVFAGGVYVTSS
jgi:hypothetical protein